MDFHFPPSLLRPRSAFSNLLIILGAALAAPAERPPTPTPPPNSLGALAQTVTLDRAALGNNGGGVVLDNLTVERIGRDASITLGVVPPLHDTRSSRGGGANTVERVRWRAAYQKQQRVIVGLERRRALLEIEVDHLENQRLTIKTMARLRNAEAKIQMLDREIAVERAELARIVRDARRHGAEPGWFR